MLGGVGIGLAFIQVCTIRTWIEISWRGGLGCGCRSHGEMVWNVGGDVTGDVGGYVTGDVGGDVMGKRFGRWVTLGCLASASCQSGYHGCPSSQIVSMVQAVVNSRLAQNISMNINPISFWNYKQNIQLYYVRTEVTG